jgi:hypothetical protein
MIVCIRGYCSAEKQRFNTLTHRLDAGAMLAFRNPRAHSIRVDDPEKAIELILFINLLVKSLDGATKV